MTATFSAPWSQQLKWTTTLTCILLLGTSLVLRLNAPLDPPLLYRIGIWIPVFIFCASTLFAILGYRVEGDSLLILRPGWHSRIPLRDLQSVEVAPDACRGSIRVFGNGGLFGTIGLFRNATLGTYRAYITDADRTVVLRRATSTVVVSPANPTHFAQTVEQLLQKRQ